MAEFVQEVKCADSKLASYLVMHDCLLLRTEETDGKKIYVFVADDRFSDFVENFNTKMKRFYY